MRSRDFSRVAHKNKYTHDVEGSKLYRNSDGDGTRKRQAHGFVASVLTWHVMKGNGISLSLSLNMFLLYLWCIILISHVFLHIG